MTMGLPTAAISSSSLKHASVSSSPVWMRGSGRRKDCSFELFPRQQAEDFVVCSLYGDVMVVS